MAGGELPVLSVAGFTLGLREGVIVLIVLVALYILFVLLRMRRLHRPPASPAASAAFRANLPPDAAEPLVEETVEEIPEEMQQRMAEELLHRGLELEIAQLREEVDALRGELAALRDDMQQEMAHVRAAQSVSPIYGDAMQMAIAGYDPAMIAERCGIARAEAELVAALARSQGQGDQE